MAELPDELEKTEKPESKKTLPLLDVVLLMPHLHAGELFQVGDKIKVTAVEQAWLRSHKLIATNGVK